MLNNHISLKKITPSYETNHHHIHRMDDHRPQRQRHWAGGRTTLLERGKLSDVDVPSL